jgi:hypothetical protein
VKGRALRATGAESSRKPSCGAIIARALGGIHDELGADSAEYISASVAAEYLDTGTCEEAGAELRDLDNMLDGPVRSRVKALWGEFSVKCPGQLESYEP